MESGKAGVPPHPREGAGSVFRHGTLYGYRRQGCRCSDCRQAATDWQRDYQREYRKGVRRRATS